MAHAPLHPHNPCSLDGNEQTPAKIWELMRRNDRFKKAVARFKDIDQRLRLVGCWRRCPHDVALVMVERLGTNHRFAGDAIEWLVPEPFFEIHHKELPANFDLSGKRFASLVTVKLEQGTTPDPADKAHWQTFEAQGELDAESVANLHGRPWRRGPHVHFQTSEDPRFCDKVNPLQEWRDYFKDGRKFTLDTPWRDAPPQFKRTLCFRWRQLDSRKTNPVTGTRIDADCEHETDFFDGWNLMDFRASGNLTRDDLAKIFRFNGIAGKYRVFAFPKSIRTRTEARRVANWLYDQLAVNLPAREPELYGSPLQWDILLTVQDLIRAGAPFDEALQESFEKLHLKADNWHEGQPMPDQKKGWAQRGADWLDTYRVLDAPLAGTGLVQTIFPGKPRNQPPVTSVS